MRQFFDQSFTTALRNDKFQDLRVLTSRGGIVSGLRLKGTRRPGRAIKRQARWIAVSLVAYLVASLLGGPVAAAAELTLAGAKAPDPVPVSAVQKHHVLRPDRTAGHAWKADSASFLAKTRHDHGERARGGNL